jgi:hypothetical protein
MSYSLQSKDEYWLDIDEKRVPLTHKEYDRQVYLLAQRKEDKVDPMFHKKKITSKKKKSLFDRLSRPKVYAIQSADEVPSDSVTGSTSNQTDEENVSFLDQNQGLIQDMSQFTHNLDETEYSPGAELGEYLSRPVLIQTLNMNLTDTTGTVTQFNPWNQYFNTTEIKKKLDYFAFIKCDLHIKVVINSSPFYYGGYILTYRPLSGLIQDNIITDGLGSHRIPYSQRPLIWLYPQSNQGGEMVLPFFYHKNWLEATSATDLTNMGQLSYVCINPLGSANGASGAGTEVEVQVFAWADNVKLMGLTQSLAVQSKDEYSEGPISQPASAVATAMGYLGDVPVIGPFATATGYAATAISKIASLFGFTNVPNINNVHAFTQKPFPALSCTQISTPVDKMALDPKNELSIDPKIVGLSGEDELSISHICKKESFLVSCAYTTSFTPGTTIFSANVQPAYYAKDSSVTRPHYNMPPMSNLQNMFSYWRGDIIFRIKVICTKFHKGRLRITYDPVGNTSVTLPSFQTAYTKIIDIGDTQDVEFVVPYSQATAWLRCQSDPFSAADTFFTPTSGAITKYNGFDNGTISITVVNNLSAPVASSSISVNVFVRGGDNLEFAMPRNLPQNYTYLALQSQDEVDYDAPDRHVAGHHENAAHPCRYLINMGENISSLRTLLRRSVYNYSVNMPDDTTNAVARMRSITTRMPFYYGYQASAYSNAFGIVDPITSYPFSYAKNIPFTWIAPMFVGWRGSMIWHYNTDSTANKAQLGSTRIARVQGAFNRGNFSEISGVTAAALSSARYQYLVSAQDAGTSGVCLTNPVTSTAQSVSLPDYNRYKFHFVDPRNCFTGSSSDDTNLDAIVYQATTYPTVTQSPKNIIIDKYVSIGTDFNFLFWLNTPTLQYIPAVTPS